MGYYDSAVVCRNGHVITDMASRSSQAGQKFCDDCGAATLSRCPNCGTPIRGDYHSDSVVFISARAPVAPKNCHECGKPYPWTRWSLFRLLGTGERREFKIPDDASLYDRVVVRAKNNRLLVAVGVLAVGITAVKPLFEFARDVGSIVSGMTADAAVEEARLDRCRYVLVDPVAELGFDDTRLLVEFTVNNGSSPRHPSKFVKVVRPEDEPKPDVMVFKGFDSSFYRFESRVQYTGGGPPSFHGATDIVLGNSKFYVMDMRLDRRPPFDFYPVSDEAAMAFASKNNIAVPECQALPRGLRW